MSYQETYDRWIQLTEEKKILELKLKETTETKRVKNNQLHTFLSMMKKEKKDVEDLEKSSLSSLLSKVTGKYEEKLMKEQEEYLEAKLLYEDKKNELQLLEEKEKRLTEELPRIDHEITVL